MLRFYVISVLLLVCVTLNSYAQGLVYESGGELKQGQAAFNVHFYELDLKIDPADSTISGSVGVHFDVVHPTNVIALDLDPKLQIEKVEWLEDGNHQDLSINRTDSSKTFHVQFPATLQPGNRSSVKITYQGKPLVASNPPWDGGVVWARTPSDEPWLGVATQTTGAWTWWPNKDHPSDKADSVSIHLTMPDNLVVASNGQSRGETDLKNGWKTTHWFVSVPINNYNITYNAAPYEVIRDKYESISGDEMDIIFWILPEFRKEGERLFPQFAEQIRFMEEIAGPYPFRADKYGVAHAPYLGMEHQSLIAYGANFKNDNLFGLNVGFDDLHQHELAHEWWGNLVTAWDWRDFWIHEGFGTYMQPLYAEYLSGEKAYREMMDFLGNRIASETDMAVAPRESMSTLDITRGSRGGDVYYKGAWFLHTLRYVIGDVHFFEALRRFAYPDPEMESITDGSHTRFATTDDFLHLSENITGMDLDWLFEVYLRQPQMPLLQANRVPGFVRLEWIVPEGYHFPMPVEVLIGGEKVTLVPDGGVISFEVEDHIEIEVDPDNRILKRFELTGSQSSDIDTDQ